MKKNESILWQNCLSMFSTEIARKAWIWYAENNPSRMHYSADDYALEVESLLLCLRPYLEFSVNVHDCSEEILTDLERFILIRHANYRLGNNVRPTFLS